MGINGIGGGGAGMSQQAMLQKVAERTMQDFDADQNGEISESEIALAKEKASQNSAPPAGRANPLEQLAQADLDGSGGISMDELKSQVAEALSQGRPPPPEGSGSGPGGPGPGGAGPGGVGSLLDELFEDSEIDPADTNGDGIVSATEEAAAAGTESDSDS